MCCVCLLKPKELMGSANPSLKIDGFCWTHQTRANATTASGRHCNSLILLISENVGSMSQDISRKETRLQEKLLHNSWLYNEYQTKSSHHSIGKSIHNRLTLILDSKIMLFKLKCNKLLLENYILWLSWESDFIKIKAEIKMYFGENGIWTCNL